MAKRKPQTAAPVKTSDGRNNGKASKKRPKIFDAIKRRLVVKSK